MTDDEPIRKSITATGDDVRVVQEALEEAADELGAELNDTKGRTGDDEISNSTAIAEIARAYLEESR
ncbi:MAG: hypothetical protein ACOCUO_00870 [archaeon]